MDDTGQNKETVLEYDKPFPLLQHIKKTVYCYWSIFVIRIKDKTSVKMDCENCVHRNTPAGIWPCHEVKFTGVCCKQFRPVLPSNKELSDIDVFETFLKRFIEEDGKKATLLVKLLYNVLKQPGIHKTNIRNSLLKLNII